MFTPHVVRQVHIHPSVLHCKPARHWSNSGSQKAILQHGGHTQGRSKRGVLEEQGFWRSMLVGVPPEKGVPN